jgi:hypothetical protein
VAVVHEPFRLSEHLGANPGREALRKFVDDRIYQTFRQHVREAVRLASGPSNGRRVST